MNLQGVSLVINVSSPDSDIVEEGVVKPRLIKFRTPLLNHILSNTIINYYYYHHYYYLYLQLNI